MRRSVERFSTTVDIRKNNGQFLTLDEIQNEAGCTDDSIHYGSLVKSVFFFFF